MNGELIPAARGVRHEWFVAGGYGDKSIKWVQRIVLTNDFKANDSDAADFNADVETAMKTKARFINAPKEVMAGKPAALTGFALIGISGIDKVQYCVHSQDKTVAGRRPILDQSRLEGRGILPAPADWGGGLPGGKLPANTSQWIRQRARLSSGRCDSLSPTGRHCSPACRQAGTTCAAVPSTATASLNRCRARS